MLSFAIVPVEPILVRVFVAKRVLQNFHSNQTGQTIKSPRDDFFMMYRQSTPNEQAMDLPPYATDQHWDPLHCLVNLFYLSRTSVLTKLMSKHLHFSKFLGTVDIYSLPAPYPEGYTIALLLSSGITTQNGTHTAKQERKCKSYFQAAQAPKGMQPWGEMFLLSANIPFTSQCCFHFFGSIWNSSPRSINKVIRN